MALECRASPRFSQHLKVPKDAGLVTERRDGTRRIYQIDPDGLGELRAQLDRSWTKALAAYKQAVEQSNEGGLMTTQAQETTVRTQIAV